MKRKKSPCIDVCDYKGPKGWCVACGLTSRECKSWKSMKPYGRQNLLRELVRRRSDMERREFSS